MTYTFAILEVSKETYEEIGIALKRAEYDQAIHENVGTYGNVLDLHGIALAQKKEEEKEEKKEEWRFMARSGYGKETIYFISNGRDSLIVDLNSDLTEPEKEIMLRRVANQLNRK